jgi:hypothetical protein
MIKSKKIIVNVMSRQEFEEYVIKLLEEEYKGSNYSVFRILLDAGFAAIDYDNLNKCLPTWGLYFGIVAVESVDPNYVWMISGNSCMLVRV